ncbi:MAG: lipoate--protein ligase family protein, partial [Candidatus Korarchaeum sp.]
MRWRLLLESGDAATNMAIDEALMRFGIPTIRFYRFSPSSVTIGYFQRVSSAVNLEEAMKGGVRVVRRITGGGSVYHDERGELTYSIVAPVELFPKGFAESMRYVCEGVVRTVRAFGLDAEFSGVNDVVVAGRKLSGSAQAREQGILLQHGTIMYATDLEKLAS